MAVLRPAAHDLAPTQGSSFSGRQPVVLIGASYAGGWQLPPLNGHPVINKGVAGQGSWQVAARFGQDALASQPVAVIVWGYINDVFRAPRDRMDEALGRARVSVETMVSQARAAGVTPIVATEVTIAPKNEWGEYLASWLGWALGKQSYQDYINGRVREVNDWLRAYAAREHLLVLDLEPVLADGTGRRRREFAKPDGSHITPGGYAALTAYAVPRLEEYLRGLAGSQR